MCGSVRETVTRQWENRLNLISEERVKKFEQNSEILMKIGLKIGKLWHFEVSQIFTNFSEIKLNLFRISALMTARSKIISCPTLLRNVRFLLFLSLTRVVQSAVSILFPVYF